MSVFAIRNKKSVIYCYNNKNIFNQDSDMQLAVDVGKMHLMSDSKIAEMFFFVLSP